MPLAAAGTRPDPAVSVPSARSTQARRHRHRRARARPARDEPGPVRVRADAVRRPGADEPGRELVQVGHADDHGAGVLRAPRPPARSPSATVAEGGHPAVVRSPATSMLSFTASVVPASGRSRTAGDARVDLRAAAAAPRRGRPARSRCRRGRRRAIAVERRVDRVGRRPASRPVAVLIAVTSSPSSSNSPASAHALALLGERGLLRATGRRRSPSAWSARNRRCSAERNVVVLDVDRQLARAPAPRACSSSSSAPTGNQRSWSKVRSSHGSVEVRAARGRGSTPARCARRTGSRPGPPCRRCRGRRRRCRPSSPASTCAPGCTSS